ncbi:unnamed protein product [Ranitomeya imitator]|uniref:Transposase n=1 Tax=Ranitomeya imitator TaxID=111125 RepID=A0ABN9MEB0_9NEOB|nr:unnamed protein product [Ranitomeya imitator]
MGKTSDLTDVKKAIIDTLKQEGKTQKEISQQIGCSQSAVSRHLNGKSVGRKQCGRKCCTTRRGDRTLRKIVEKDRFQTLGNLRKQWTESGVETSRATVHRRVQEMGYRCRIPQSRASSCKFHTSPSFQAEIVGIDADIQREFARQREHLERSLSTLQKKLVKDTEIHRADNVRVMQENVTLIKEINELRRELKISRTKVHDLEVALGVERKNRRSSLADSKGSSISDPHASGVLRLNIEEETARIIELQKLEIKRLHAVLQSQDVTAGIRPSSVGRLPSLTT